MVWDRVSVRPELVEGPDRATTRPARTAFPGWPPPLTGALNRLSLAVRRRARSPYAGAVRSVSRGRALEFAAHRPYTPGDDPRLIDWRAYSRLDRVFLKQFDEERARRVTLLLDASASMGALGPDDAPDTHKGLFARRLAAALAWIALGRGDGVRTVLLKSGRAEALPPVGSRAGVAALFDALSSALEDGGVGLGGAVRAALGSLPPMRSAGPVLLISDLLDPTWPDALDALGPHEAAVIQPLAPTEWSPALGDEVELEDAETGELRPTRLDPAELTAYAARLDRFLADVRVRCARHDVAHAALDTGAGLEEALLTRLTAARILE